jgi:hypothetical protein
MMDVFAPQEGESVTVMVDMPHDVLTWNSAWEERLEMAQLWRDSIEDLGRRKGFSTNPILSFEATGTNNGPLPKQGQLGAEAVRIEDVLRETNICLAITEFSASAPLLFFVERIPTLRVASLPGVLRRMEETALSADYNIVAERSHILAEKLTSAESAITRFSTGHEVTIDLRFRTAHSDDGRCWPGGTAQERFINLPSGEAYIVPYEGERGGEKSLTRGDIPINLDDQIVVLRVEQNNIIDVQGHGDRARQLSHFFSSDDGRRNVAELGLGCNDKAIVTGNVLEDEKAGFHWAYGLSEHLGGSKGENSFERSQNVVHTDIVYAHGNPIEIHRLTLEYPDGSKEEIIRDSVYRVF